MKAGKVIPRYRHVVLLRNTDPGFMLQLKFAAKNIKNDNLLDLVKVNFEIIPDHATTDQEPLPNDDCGSGALLMHYGLTEHDFYTALFGVSRAFDVMPAQVWSRALGMSIECPNSFDLENLREVVSQFKYIVPEKIENIVALSLFIEQSFLNGDSLQNHCVIIIVPTLDEVYKFHASG